MTTATTATLRTPPARTGQTTAGSPHRPPRPPCRRSPGCAGWRRCWCSDCTCTTSAGSAAPVAASCPGPSAPVPPECRSSSCCPDSYWTWSARPRDRALAFWRRRIARIYPVHLATLAVALVMAYTLAHQARPTAKQTLANALLLHSWWQPWWQTLNPVSWSLACEAFFLRRLPAADPAAAPARRARLGRAGGALSVAAVLVLAWADAHHWWTHSVYSLPGRAAARVRARRGHRAAGVARPLARARPGGVALALAVIGYFLVPQVTPGYSATVCTIAGFALLIPRRPSPTCTACRPCGGAGGWYGSGGCRSPLHDPPAGAARRDGGARQEAPLRRPGGARGHRGRVPPSRSACRGCCTRGWSVRHGACCCAAGGLATKPGPVPARREAPVPARD
ncbi:hypothetical protein LT493_44565 [Streptomyces tricolor]|nr:hypothetical protein [Streptomyces tricolor]